MDGGMDGWMEGWVGGWKNGVAGESLGSHQAGTRCWRRSSHNNNSSSNVGTRAFAPSACTFTPSLLPIGKMPGIAGRGGPALPAPGGFCSEAPGPCSSLMSKCSRPDHSDPLRDPQSLLRAKNEGREAGMGRGGVVGGDAPLLCYKMLPVEQPDKRRQRLMLT